MATYFRSDGWVKSAVGPAVAGAQIYVCTQPANIENLPPSPLAPVFSDSNGLVPITQPILTDGFGHYDFYVLPGFYTIVVGLGGRIQRTYPDQTIGISGSTSSSLELEVNGVPNIDQNLLNLKNSATVTVVDNGDGSVSLSNAAAGLVVKTNGVNNGSQSILNLKSGTGISLADDGVGGVTITNTAPSIAGDFSFACIHGFSGSSGAFSAPDFPRLGMCYNAINSQNPAVADPTATEGASYKTTTAPAIYNVLAEDCLVGSAAGSHTAVYSSSFGSLLTLQMKVKLADTLDATCIAWFGMGDNQELLPYNAADPSSAYCTLFKANGATQTWVVYVSNGTTSQQVNTGIALDTAYHTLTVLYSTTSITFYIDGVLVATVTTNLPPAVGSPAWMMWFYNPTAVASPEQACQVLYAWWQTA